MLATTLLMSARRLASWADDKRANKAQHHAILRITRVCCARLRIKCDDNACSALRQVAYRDGSEELAMGYDGRLRDIWPRALAGQSKHDVCGAPVPEQDAISGAPRGKPIAVTGVEHS